MGGGEGVYFPLIYLCLCVDVLKYFSSVPLVPLRHPARRTRRHGHQRHGAGREQRVARRRVPDQDDPFQAISGWVGR